MNLKDMMNVVMNEIGYKTGETIDLSPLVKGAYVELHDNGYIIYNQYIICICDKNGKVYYEAPQGA